MGANPIFAAHPNYCGIQWKGLPDSIMVVRLFLVQFVLVRIQVGQREGKVNSLSLFACIAGQATNNRDKCLRVLPHQWGNSIKYRINKKQYFGIDEYIFVMHILK